MTRPATTTTAALLDEYAGRIAAMADPRAALSRLAIAGHRIDALTFAVVETARHRGVSWEQMADRLGLDETTVRHRFGR